jgi:hypothetical protein
MVLQNKFDADYFSPSLDFSTTRRLPIRFETLNNDLKPRQQKTEASMKFAHSVQSKETPERSKAFPGIFHPQKLLDSDSERSLQSVILCLCPQHVHPLSGNP